MTRWAVLGSGVVGQTLAGGLKTHGHDVRIGSRTPSKLADFSSASGIPSGTFPDVAAWAEGIVLAVRGNAAVSALHDAGHANLARKVVIDVTNPIADDAPEDGVVRFFTGPNDSLMERLQAAFPDARFVKAFSCVGSALMVNPDFGAIVPTMFYCGNDAAAKMDVEKVIAAFGWEPADMGTAKGARAIEPLCQLWCIPGMRQNQWRHAFKLVR